MAQRDLSLGMAVDTAGGKIAVDDQVNLPPASDQLENRNCKCRGVFNNANNLVFDNADLRPQFAAMADSRQLQVVSPQNGATFGRYG
jgi:hypothetical protein